MNKSEKTDLVPKLRFPDFIDVGEWRDDFLGELSVILRGGSPRPIEDYLTKDPHGLNWLKIGDVDKEEKYITKTSEKVLHQALTKTREVNPSDLIMSNSMSFGRPYILKIKTCIHDGWIAVTAIKNHISVDYLYYFILSNASQKYFMGAAAGGGIKNLNAEIIKMLSVKFPEDLTEQQKIADCLSSLDALITAEDKKLSALKAHKKGLMQKLFPVEGEAVPEWRFPEFQGEWIIASLANVIDRKIKWSFTGGPFGSNLKSSDYTSNGIRVIQLQNIGDGKYIDIYRIFTSEEKADELLSCNIYSGEIIMSKMGDPVGRACLIPNIHTRYLMCSDGIRLVVDEEHNNKYFIYSLINSDAFRTVIENNATGSTRKRIGLDVLKNLPRIVNLLSHGNYSLFDPREMVPENKEYFKTILHNFLEDYNFNKKLFEDGQNQEEEK